MQEENLAGTSSANISEDALKPKRKAWLAKPHAPPLARQELKTPVPYVIISHTAHSTSTDPAENVAIVHSIQALHMGINRWGDIGYNFLIGGDANIYKGRGWKLLGAHTSNYNAVAIGISFVGNFSTVLPSAAAMEACKLLIAKGVTDGYISPEYKLLGHCQCLPMESPGRRLFLELQTWPHWAESP